MTDRIKWIDFAKVIGIWLVVLGHMQLRTVSVIYVIYSFHMPLFFFIAGYLVKPKSIKETVKKNISTLVFPYVLYYLLSWIWWFLMSYLRHPELFDHKRTIQDIFIKPFFGLLFGVGYNTNVSTMLNNPIWFLIGLAFVSLLFALIFKSKNNMVIILITILLAFIAYTLSILQIDLLFSIDSALMAFPFYTLGYYTKKVINSTKIVILKERRFLKSFALLIVFGASLVVLASFNGLVDINHLIFGRSPLLFYLNGIVGITCIIVIANIISRFHNNLIIEISNGTIFIMGVHAIITGLLLRATKKINLDANIIESIGISLLVIIICIPLIILAKRKFPLLLGNRTAVSTR